MDETSDLPKDAVAHYDQFFGPFYFEPYAIAVAQRIKSGHLSVVLEIASGTGRVTRPLRENLPASATLFASDIDENMLTFAKKKLAHLDIMWQHIDAQQIPFPDNSIDVVVCCFGYMFVPDKAKAFAEAYRVLKPGGQLLFTTWDKLEYNGASYTSRMLAMKYFGEPMPKAADLATSMSDEAPIKKLLYHAGFTTVSVEKLQLYGMMATAREAANGLVSGAIYEEIQKRNPAVIHEIKSKLENELANKFGAAPMVAPISALMCEAWK